MGTRALLLRLPRHAAVAFRPVPLVFVACTTAGLVLALHAGLLGLPLGLVLLAWLAKYAFVLLEASAHGLPPPVLAIEMLNPFDERRPLGVLFAGAAVVGVAGLVREFAGDGAAAALLAPIALGAPAALALLAIDGSWLRALAPGACWRVARGLGVGYAVVLAALLAVVALGRLVVESLPLGLALAAVQLLGLGWATLLGGVLFERRDALGLDAVADPARAAARTAAAAAKGRAERLAEAYALVRARRLPEAWAVLEAEAAARHREPAAWRELLECVAGWGEPRLERRVRQALVARLLALGRRGDALLEVERAWRARREWRPGDARELAALVRTARDVGHAASAERLLDEHGREHADDPDVGALLARRGR